MGELQLPFALQPSSFYKDIPTSSSCTLDLDSPLLSPAPPPPRRKLTILGIPIFTFKRNKPRRPPEEPDRQKKAAAKKTHCPFFSSAGPKRSKEVAGSTSVRDSEERNRGMKGGREPPIKVEYRNANEKLSRNSYAGAGSWNPFGLPSSPLRSSLEVILEDVASNTKEKGGDDGVEGIKLELFTPSPSHSGSPPQSGDDGVEGIKLELFTPSPSHSGSPPQTFSGIFDDIAHNAEEKRGEETKLYIFSPSPSHGSSPPPTLDAKENRDEEIKWTTFSPSPNYGGSPPLPTLSSIPGDIACNANERSDEENKLDLFSPFPCRGGSLPWTLGDIARNAFNPFPSHGGSPPSTNAKEARGGNGEEKMKWDSFSPSPSHGGSSQPPTLSDILDNIACNAKERGGEGTKLDFFSPSPNHGGSTPPTISHITHNAEEKRDEDCEEKMKLDIFRPSKSHGGSPPQTLSGILDENNNGCVEEIKLNIFSPSQSRSGSPKVPPTTTCHVKEDEEDEINWNPIRPSEPSKVPSEMVAHRTGGLIRRDPPHLQMMLIPRKIAVMQKVVRAISYSQGLFSGLLSDAKRSTVFLAVSEIGTDGKGGPQLCNKRILMGKRCRPLDIEEGRFDGGSGPVARAENVPRRDGINGSG